jgi:hypothetical protein
MERLSYEMTREAQSFKRRVLEAHIAEWKGPCACCFV